MKKITALMLAVLMLFSVCSVCTASAAGNVSAFCGDNNPISLAEVNAVEYNPCFYLSASEIDYRFILLMPDGSVQTLNYDKNAAAEGKYFNYGYAYVDFDECKNAFEKGSSTVPVHVWVSVSEKQNNTYKEIGQFEYTLNKTLVDSFIVSITPVSGAPSYLFENSGAYELDNTVFEIRYWDNKVENVKPVRSADFGEKPTYTINGKPLRYLVNHDNMQVYLSYMDATYICKVEETKEFPFEAIQLLDCELNGDMPKKIRYRVTWLDGKKRDYSATVNSYSGYVNYLDGYAISFSTEGSVYASTVTVEIGNKLSHGISYEIEQSSPISRFIAKIVLFFTRIFQAIF